ncbi:MAG: D-alanine--D-alanine ligase [Gracilibacteraceae bacterium]|jgi:D-alanine-D-alanine ligase|nr:D-alanine--D-alanine ligase [Gracilibacteraceae bacterium]
MEKIKLLILFGGQSSEHAVSVASAQSVCENLDRKKYAVRTLGITKQGRWYLGVTPAEWLAADDSLGRAGAETALHLAPGSSGFWPLAGGSAGVYRPDAVFPLLHGPQGEDGTVQGLLTLAALPFVGCGVLGGALGMDKDRMKAVFREAGLPVGPYLTLTAARRRDEAVLARIEKELGYPCFVKPARMGSSVGITKAAARGELTAGLELAARYDDKIVVERGISGREMEISVLDGDPPRISVPGEIILAAGFYDYEAKYISADSRLIVPAPLSAEVGEKLADCGRRAFAAVDGRGLARVDFFVTAAGEVYVNEINTMPGFTNISMYPRLWRASGLPYAELLDQLIELAFKKFDPRLIP